ncbi:MAG: outer membrane lipoprotein-sorting protein [Chloroflexota bacterium]|nr:outer membrane lipoprotein-sorting protein [Chloroflexota bacterium]MDQ5864984.1 outer membrane lipoprotein-sorting protein [Chloroflexota bacterium]
MNEELVRNALKEDAQSNRGGNVDVWPAVRNRLLAEKSGRHASVQSRRPSFRAPTLYAGVALALVVLAALASASFLGPKEVSAAEVMARLHQAAQDPNALGVQSLEGVYTQEFTGPGTENADMAKMENHIWYQAPDKQRTESRTKSGKLMIAIQDGETGWLYEPEAQRVTRYNWASTWIDYTSVGGVELQNLLANTAEGYDVQMLDSEQVAGRATHVLQLTPRMETSVELPWTPNRKKLWVDQETYLILKYEEEDDDYGHYRTWTYTSVTVNPDLNPDLFSFSPPADAEVIDEQDETGPTGRLVREQWQQMAARVTFPLFMFVTLPDSFEVVEGPVQDNDNPNRVVQRLRWLPDEEDTVTLIQEPGPLPDTSTLGERVVLPGFVGYLKRDGNVKWLTWEEQGTMITLIGRWGIDVKILLRFPENLQRVRVP